MITVARQEDSENLILFVESDDDTSLALNIFQCDDGEITIYQGKDCVALNTSLAKELIKALRRLL